MRRRWDVDERGRGVASADRYLAHADDLRAAMAEPDWVAEDPEHHLLPHVRRFCDGSDVLHLDDWSVDDGVLVLGLTYAGGTWRERHEAVYAVVEGDSEFAPHGHTVMLRVGGASPAK